MVIEGNCPYQHPCGLHRVQCDLVSALAGVDLEQAVVPTRACADCLLNPPTPEQPNETVIHFAKRAALRANPDGASAVHAELTALAPRFAQKPEPAGRTVVLNADAHGFGDAMVTAWISEGAKQGPVRLIHHATGRMRDFLELWGQEVTPNGEGAVTTFRAYEIETRREKGSVPRVLTRGRHLGIFSAPQRPRLQRIPEESIEWASRIQIDRTNGGERPFVLLCPQTCYRSREWPAAYWIDLAWRLEKAGIAVGFNLHQRDERFENSPQFYWGYDWPHIMALMLLSDLVVGIDSAPIHVSGTLDVRTLALFGATTASVISHCPSVTCLSAPPERLDCVGCWFNAPYRAACDQGCMSLQRLFVEDVEAKVREILDEPGHDERGVRPVPRRALGAPAGGEGPGRLLAGPAE